ncbi:trypsin 3A1-like [Bacillus rossius redtenbacheri]|uniref:trypsin 3A1-like n=1 Tax=Bacillus rossius redtenbacheri TaxID=93214 RepID=UPI002FDD910C
MDVGVSSWPTWLTEKVRPDVGGTTHALGGNPSLPVAAAAGYLDGCHTRPARTASAARRDQPAGPSRMSWQLILVLVLRAVSIRKWGQHFCGGTIINEEWILTAAHCVHNECWNGRSEGHDGKNTCRNASELSVVAGSTRLSEGGVQRHVSLCVEHPRYNQSDAYKNDVAVVKMTSPLNFTSSIQPVTLPANPRSATPSGLCGTAVGWGLLSTDGKVSDELQEVDLLTYDATSCRKAHLGYTHHNNFCAGAPEGGKAQCTGDSGGPFLTDGVQTGVVSWSVKPCGSRGFPGVLTEVSFFLAWIRRRTRPAP